MKDKLEALKNHPYYKNYFKKFKKDDIAYMNLFISELEVMSQEEKVIAVCRSAMRSNKPRNWAAIEELLSIIIK